MERTSWTRPVQVDQGGEGERERGKRQMYRIGEGREGEERSERDMREM